MLKMCELSRCRAIFFLITFLLLRDSTCDRSRRDSSLSQSLLTVEWEGIQTGDHPDDSVGGFAVEYRAEKDTQWHVHDGIIPYKGPNLQYRVQIPRLPTGVAYFVRIKVLGKNGKILVETPEIRARNEMVSIKCESDDITAPRNLEVIQTGQYSIAMIWESPECGSVGEYHVELSGVKAEYDVHRLTVTHPSVSVTNLLPGTEYRVRVRAADRAHNLGPWNENELLAETDGRAPEISEEISIDYRSDREFRIHWKPYEDSRLQYYEVMAVEANNEGKSLERTRVGAHLNSHLFSGFHANTEYHVGIVAFVEHEPQRIYRVDVKTSGSQGIEWTDKPIIITEDPQNISIQWKKPDGDQNIVHFVIEYRLPNETEWRKYSTLKCEDDSSIYRVSLTDNVTLYSVRILAVDDHLRLASRSPELTVGKVTSESCAGKGGVPINIHASSESGREIRFTWEKPVCDEAYGAFDGFEYRVWNVESGSEPDNGSYIPQNYVILNELEPDSRYAFRVRSRAGHGQSPWSETVFANTESQYGIHDEQNIYKLRIVLAPPKSFLVWTPMPEHKDEIEQFKLSYKVSAGGEWKRIVGPGEDFKCPEGVADSEDYCYDLSTLSYGVQYTADLVYKSRNDGWSPHGSPLFFILVEAGRKSLAIRGARVVQRGPRTIVYWDVIDDTSDIAAYQIDIRTQADREWRLFNGYIAHSPGETHFRHELELRTQGHYQIRIAAIDAMRKILATSETIELFINCLVPSEFPKNLQANELEGRVVLSWTHEDENGPECESYFLISGSVNGIPVSEKVDGDVRDYRFNEQLAGDWELRIQAGTRAGSGPVSPVVRFRNQPKELVSTPILTARGSDLNVEWMSSGNGQGVYGYRVQFRTRTTGWTPYGQLVPYVGDNEHYSQLLTGLEPGHDYSVHVQVLDRNSYVMYVSPEISAKTTCSAPTHPPSHLKLQTPDSRHVVAQWISPPQSTWMCSQAQVELEITEPPGVPPVNLDAHQNTHVFSSEPNQQWAIRIRMRNSAGKSSWSQIASTRTPDLSELIIGPLVTYQHGAPIVSWKSKERVDDLVRAYQLEWRSTTNPIWRKHENLIPYTGWQRPYMVDVGSLPSGHQYQARVVAIDANNGIAYTSPIVDFHIQLNCNPPRRSPSDVRATPIGPTQISVTWRPLHESEWNCDRIWYIVKYSTPRNQGFKNLTSGENQIIFDSEPFTQWNFEVQAANPSGETRFSNPISAQTQGTAPGPVSDLRIHPLSSNSVQMSWRQPQNPNGRITGYEITYQLLSRGMCDRNVEKPLTVVSERPSYTLQGLLPHSSYRINVAAKTNIAGEPVVQQIQTEESTPSSPPLYIRAEELLTDQMVLTWQAPPCLQTNGEITEYEYEIKSADIRLNTITNTVRGTRARLANLVPFTKYYVRIRAFTRKGPGPWSEPLLVQTAPTQQISPPSQPKVLVNRGDEAHLVWQEPQSSQGYIDKFKCQYAVMGTQDYNEKRFPAVNPCPQDVIKFERLPQEGPRWHCGRIDGLQPEKEYEFQVSAGSPTGEWSPWSEPKRTWISQKPIRILSVDKIGSSANTLIIRWNINPSDASRITGYRIHISQVGYPSTLQTFTVDHSTYQYQIDNLHQNTRYNITVEAATGSEYHQGTTVEMHTDSARPAEIHVQPRIIEEQATGITIEWNAPQENIGGFIIEYRIDNGAWQQYPRRVPLYPGRRTYTSKIEQLPTNSAVDIRVRVVSTHNEQLTPGPEVRARTKCSPPPFPPQAIRLDSPRMNEVRVSWARTAKDTWQCDQLNFEIAYRAGNDAEKIIPVPGDQTEYTFSAEPNSRWAIKLRSSNQAGSSPWSTEEVIATRQGIPGSVRDLRLRAISPNEVRVHWLAPLVQRGTIVGYDISYRLKHRLACPDEEPRDVSRDFVTVYNHKDLEYTLTGLLPFSLYEVRVRARTTDVGPEETREIATEQQPPSAPPLNLQLGFTLERSINFQWEPVDCSQRHGHITNYEYEILGQDDWAKLERQIANTTDNRITIEGLTPFTKYVMRVKAYNSIGGGPNTENLDAMTAKADTPLPPQDLVVAQEGTDFFMISWLPPYPPYGPHDAYKIRYQNLDDSDWKTIERNIKDPSLKCPADSPRFCFNISGLENGQQYRAQVATHIEEGSYGPWSTVIIANTLQVLPDAPRAIELIEKTDHSLHIRWVPPADPMGHITQYKVSITSMEDPTEEPRTYLVDHPKLQYLLDNLRPETSYNVSISAGTSRGFGPIIWTRYSTYPFKVPPVTSAPVLRAEGANTINVQWNGVPEGKDHIRGYIIEYRSSDNPNFIEYGKIVDHVEWKRTYEQKMTNLDADTLYFVRVKVVDAKQRVSQPSPEASVRTGCSAPLSPPPNVDVNSPVSTQIKIIWQAPPQSSWRCSNVRYKIEYINGTAPPEHIDLPSGTTEHVAESGPNTLWKVRVRLENDAGASPWSKEVSVRTKEGAPGTVEDLAARANSPNSAIVSWKTPMQTNGVITGYTVVYKLKSIGECGPRSSQPIMKTSLQENLVLDGLLPDSTYEVYVVAHTAQSGPQSKIITFTTEESAPTGAPLNVRMSSVAQTRGDLLWNEPECESRNGKITGYDYILESLDVWAENQSDHTAVQRVYFDKLIPFTRYRARVRAKNSLGPGPFSEWIEFQTLPAAPSSPTDLNEEQSFPHAIEISFARPFPPHGNLDEFRIRHTPARQRNYKEVRVSADRLQCSDSSKRDRLCYRVVDLEPELEYEIQAAAHTSGGGWSPWSESLFASTHEQNIPVLERELEIEDTKPNSITVRWRGLDSDQIAHIVGYILEYKTDEEGEWKEYDGITKHRARANDYKVTVRQLEPSTEYFFRLKVVGKNDKRGAPGPEARATTDCGKPESPPDDFKAESLDFETIKISWKKPEESSWNCKDVEYLIEFVNTTSRGVLAVPGDSDYKILSTLPGTKWQMRIRTQTIEKDRKPSFSPWSDRITLITQALPGELFVKVEPTSPSSAIAQWDVADQDQKWSYGVDLVYKLKQLGGCQELRPSDQEAFTIHNVLEKQVVLSDLKPGSEYEVIVTPRRPPALHSSVVAPKTIRKFRTESDLPSGPPLNLRGESRKDDEISFRWDPPACELQNGKITQYEYEINGVEEWNEDKREGVTPRLNAVVSQLKPGSLYEIKVRAYTSEGAGPWTESIRVRTAGSELGPPRELTAVQTKPESVQMTWLPPYPERAPVVTYRFKYSPRTDDSQPVQFEVSGDQMSCQGYKSPLITDDNVCTTISYLQPDTTYRFSVQAQSPSGNWGEWSSPYFATTRSSDDGPIYGKLRLVSAGHDNLRVNWTIPPVIREAVDQIMLNISVASALDQKPKGHIIDSRFTDFHFRGLNPVTHYNITVQGLSGGRHLWFITEVFATTDYALGLLSWLPAPTDLKLLEKSDKMMHVAWSPPEIFDPQYKDLITHYRVTITPVDPMFPSRSRPRNYTVPYPGTSIRFEDLEPETIYNITVQAGTSSGYGQVLWGVYSTLAPSQSHILRLLDRTPTTLTVEWEPRWIADRGYLLTWKPVHSVFPHVRLNSIKSAVIDQNIRNFTIEHLDPSTVYNVTLQPRGGAEIAWGAYATLPPGWFIVRNFIVCDRTNYAVSLSWRPIELNMASHYQIRYLYLKDHDAVWVEESERRSVELLCPKDGCRRHCYLVYNLEYKPSEYVFQVRARVNGQWNQWKMAGRPDIVQRPEVKQACCIVPPPYIVEGIGLPGTYWEVDVAPVESRPQNISRYYVVVDEREPAGSTNWTELTDKVTATRLKLPYYVAASYNAETLPTARKVRLGDGTVIGGYLNYPLIKGKKYNYEVYSVWELDGKPAVVARQRAAAYAVAGWPWWWLLLLLLLLLLLILLTCCILWCLQGRYRSSKLTRTTTNGQTVPLLAADVEKNGIEKNMQALSSRIEDIRSSLENKTSTRGDFEDGYVRGFRDANKLGSASAARRRMDDDYGSRDDRFHEGYVKGLRDAGMTGMTTSMHNLAQKGQGGGYSSGYMQGFRDGNSGVFGDRISTNLLRRLEEQYPNQEEFRTGYIDGFKEGAGTRTTERKSFEESRRLQESLTKLTEILQDKSRGAGDEIHTTKIYHVYNQQPEAVSTVYSSGRQLEHELEELTSSSRRSTLRKHYTPGDYLKYGSETEGYGSLARNRRSLSASALGRETSERSRYHSGTGTSYISRASAAERSGADAFSRRYNYRSRSDVGSPRRYASQTLLDGARPGPSTPHVRRDALHTLQRELDYLSRSPDRSTPRGYSSDTGYMNDTFRSRTKGGYSNIDYDSYQANKSEVKSSMTEGVTSSTRSPLSIPIKTVVSYPVSHKEVTAETSSSARNWPDDLIDIVNEPMGQTLDRMKKYSSSMSQVDRDVEDDGVKESVEERYHRSYKEEYSSGSGKR